MALLGRRFRQSRRRPERVFLDAAGLIYDRARASGGITVSLVDFAIFSFEFDRVRCIWFRRSWCETGASRLLVRRSRD